MKTSYIGAYSSSSELPFLDDDYAIYRNFVPRESAEHVANTSSERLLDGASTNGTRTAWTSSFSLNYTVSGMISVAILLFFVIVATAVGNLMVGVALFRYRYLRTVSNFLIGNLALSDFLLATTILPLSTVQELLGHWVFGQLLCNLWLILDVLYCTASIWNLCIIAFDRFTATLYPIWYREKRSTRLAAIYAAMVWVIASAICVPPLLGWNDLSQNFVYDDESGVSHCILFQNQGYVVYSACGSFYLPFLVTFFFYVKILVVLRRRMGTIQGVAASSWTGPARSDPRLLRSLLRQNEFTSVAFMKAIVFDVPSEFRSRAATARDRNSDETGYKFCRREEETTPRLMVTNENGTEIRWNYMHGEPEVMRSKCSVDWFPGYHGSSIPEHCETSMRQTRKEEAEVREKNMEEAAVGISIAFSPIGKASTTADEITSAIGKNESGGTAAGIASGTTNEESGRAAAITARVDSSNIASGTANLATMRSCKSGPEMVRKVGRTRRRLSCRSSRRQRYEQQREMRATARMAIIIAFFCGMWLGFFVVYTLRGCCPDCPVPRKLDAFFFWLGYSNSSINPILYTIFNDDFRRAFHRILSGCCSCTSDADARSIGRPGSNTKANTCCSPISTAPSERS